MWGWSAVRSRRVDEPKGRGLMLNNDPAEEWDTRSPEKRVKEQPRDTQGLFCGVTGRREGRSRGNHETTQRVEKGFKVTW